MKLLSPLIIFMVIGTLACNAKRSKYQEQVNIAKKLIECIKQNDTACVKAMIGMGSEEWGFPIESIVHSTGSLSEFFKNASPAPEHKYEFKEYPENRPELVDIIIPIKGSELKDARLKISFVKYIEAGKIFRFEFSFTRDEDFYKKIEPPK